MPLASISVVIPMYNRASTVIATLNSVATQTRPPTRLIVVDDGSSDDSVTRVEEWMRIRGRGLGGRLICQPHGGVSAARNRGFAAAQPCSLVAFLDSDDIWPTDFLARANAAFEGTPKAIAATCDRLLYQCGRHAIRMDDMATMAKAPLLWMLKHGAGIASATVFSAAAIQRRGGFDESLETGEDAALFLPIALDGPWLHVPGRPVEFNRRMLRGGKSEPNLSERFTDNFRRWARVYQGFFAQVRGQSAVAAQTYRPLLSKLWYRAGRELSRGGCLQDACDCYRAAIQWDVCNYKAWQHLAQSTLYRRMRGLAGPSQWNGKAGTTGLDGDEFSVKPRADHEFEMA